MRMHREGSLAQCFRVPMYAVVGVHSSIAIGVSASLGPSASFLAIVRACRPRSCGALVVSLVARPCAKSVRVRDPEVAPTSPSGSSSGRRETAIPPKMGDRVLMLGHSGRRLAAESVRHRLVCVSALGSEMYGLPMSIRSIDLLPDDAPVVLGRSHQTGFFERLLESTEGRAFLHCVSRSHLEVTELRVGRGFRVLCRSGNPVVLGGKGLGRGESGHASVGDEIEFIAANRSGGCGAEGRPTVYLAFRFEIAEVGADAPFAGPGGQQDPNHRQPCGTVRKRHGQLQPPPQSELVGTVFGLHAPPQPTPAPVASPEDSRQIVEPAQLQLPQEGQADASLALQPAGTTLGLHAPSAPVFREPSPPQGARLHTTSSARDADAERAAPGGACSAAGECLGEPTRPELGLPPYAAEAPRTDAGGHVQTSLLAEAPFYLLLSGSAVLPSLRQELRRIDGREDGLTVGRAHQQKLHSAAFAAEVQQLVSRDHFRIERHGDTGLCRLIALSQNPIWLERPGGSRQQLLLGQPLSLAAGDRILLFTGTRDLSPQGPPGSLCWTFSGASAAEAPEEAATRVFSLRDGAAPERSQALHAKPRFCCAPSPSEAEAMRPSASKERSCGFASLFGASGPASHSAAFRTT